MARKAAVKKPRTPRKPEKLAAPTGLHAPMTNVVTGPARAGRELVSRPDVGQAEGVLEPRESGFEALRSDIALESAQPITAPTDVRLPDIGAASFTDPRMQLETVHGFDNRIRVTETDKYPYRVNASLLITARDGSQWIGTGWFISARTPAVRVGKMPS